MTNTSKTERKIKLKSFQIFRTYVAGSYQATIELEGEYGEQKIRLSDDQTARIVDTALEVLAQSVAEQSALIAAQITGELEAVSGRAKLAAPVQDAEVVE